MLRKAASGFCVRKSNKYLLFNYKDLWWNERRDTNTSHLGPIKKNWVPEYMWFFFSFFFFQKRNGSSQALAHEAWHGLIEVGWLRHLDAISEKTRRFITFNKWETFNEWEAKLPAGSAMGRWIYTCAWVCSIFLKKGIRVKVAFWNRENTKMPKRCFQDKCISLQKLPGFPGVATHRGSTIWLSCCHNRGEHSLGTGQNRMFLRTGWKTRRKNWSQEAADHPRPGKTLHWVRS